MEQFKCIVRSDGNKIIGQIIWNITEMLKNINEINLPVYKYFVDDLYKREGFHGDAEYAMKTNNKEPCIIANLDENIEILIDGEHRLYKAKQLGMETILCYVLPFEFHKKFIIDYDEKIYKKVTVDFR